MRFRAPEVMSQDSCLVHLNAVGLVLHPRRHCPQVIATIEHWAVARCNELLRLAVQVAAYQLTPSRRWTPHNWLSVPISWSASMAMAHAAGVAAGMRVLHSGARGESGAAGLPA